MNLTHRLIVEAVLDGRHSTRSIVSHIRNRTGLQTKVVRIDIFIMQLIEARILTCKFHQGRWDFDHAECFIHRKARPRLGSLGFTDRGSRLPDPQPHPST